MEMKVAVLLGVWFALMGALATIRVVKDYK